MILLLARALEQDERVMLIGSAMVGPKTFPSASSLRPDLVVMDEHFAGVDCTALTRHLKELANPPTIFIVSSDGRTESQSRILAAGADAVLINAPNLSRQLADTVRTFFPEAKAGRGGRDNERSDSPHLNERENNIQSLEQRVGLDCTSSRRRFSLSPRQKGGVRGNKTHALRNRYPCKIAGSRKGEPQTPVTL
jgi:DNA-binding NarL/FixJ family response regulator